MGYEDARTWCVYTFNSDYLYYFYLCVYVNVYIACVCIHVCCVCMCVGHADVMTYAGYRTTGGNQFSSSVTWDSGSSTDHQVFHQVPLSAELPHWLLL